MKPFIPVAALALMLLLLAGCGSSSESKGHVNAPANVAHSTHPDAVTATPAVTPISPASQAGFQAVYADICRLLETGNQDLDYAYATVGMLEVILSKSTKAERCSSIAYALEDIDQDGSREMIVLDASDNTRILAIFAIQNGQPVITHEGWARSRLYRLSDGTLYTEGSGGTAYSILEAYGHRWFTYPKDNEQTQIGYYYAADGSYDPATAQEISADEYQAKQTELIQKITAFSVYPFC